MIILKTRKTSELLIIIDSPNRIQPKQRAPILWWSVRVLVTMAAAPVHVYWCAR